MVVIMNISNLPQPGTFSTSPNRYTLHEQGLTLEEQKQVMALYEWYRDDEIQNLVS